MQDEELSTASDGGAGVTPEQQEASQGSQESAQSQSTEPTSVDSGESQASSKGQQARENFNWANQRLLEKQIRKVLSSALDERLAPLMERLNPPQNPPASPSKDEIDFNDLPGSIKRLVEAQLGQKINPSKLKEEILGDLQTKTTRQEARKYLISQQDIGTDPAKHEEIQNIIANDEILMEAVGKHPLKVMQKAIEVWRASRTNPNAPLKAELGTIAGGMGNNQRRGADPLQKIKEISDKLMDPSLTITDKEKLSREFDTLVSSFK